MALVYISSRWVRFVKGQCRNKRGLTEKIGLTVATLRGLTILMVFIFVGLMQPQSSFAVTVFSDDFNDGNADGWMFVSADGRVSDPASSWSVVGGRLLDSSYADGQMALVENLPLSSQTIEVQADIIAWAGIVLWYKDLNNFVYAAKYPCNNCAIYVGELDNGIGYGAAYPYSGSQSGLCDFKVDANSLTGKFDFYIGGDYFFTHTVQTNLRTGLSGLIGSNGGVYFDNFQVTSSIPEPSTLLLLGAGLSGVRLMRRKLKK